MLEKIGWNNDLNKYSIKQKLENKLIDAYDLNIQRIITNIRTTINQNDPFMNKWSSGFIFYFLTLPVAKKFNIDIMFKSSEMEAAINFTDYDLSLNPRLTPQISFPLEKYPLILPIFNGHSKIQMFEELSKTKFFKYIYSCFKNTEKRWCGKCPKCFRISKYCEILNIDKSKIGMQEGINGKIEYSSPQSINYQILMSLLYPNKKSLFKKFFLYWCLNNFSLSYLQKKIISRLKRLGF